MNRLTGDWLTRCDGCGQTWLIRREYDLNLNAPRFCPCCGTDTLQFVDVKKISSSIFGAACFKGIIPKLTELLFSMWADERRTAPTGTPIKHLRFIDYLREQLKKG